MHPLGKDAHITKKVTKRGRGEKQTVAQTPLYNQVLFRHLGSKHVGATFLLNTVLCRGGGPTAKDKSQGSGTGEGPSKKEGIFRKTELFQRRAVQ